MNQYNDKRQRHGPWEDYFSNGKLGYKTNYVNGKEHGLSEDYYCSNGNLSYKANYVNGKEHGLSERYSSNGKLYFKQYHL